MKKKIPRIVLGAISSGSGKTLLTCGLLQAFMNRGYKTVSFKCGPDYIDPMFHSHVLGTKSRNLDSFLAEEETVTYLLGENAKDMDIAVIEGVMGFYDGLGGISTKGSTYDVARITKSPVILIINAKGMSLSLIPVIKGFMEYREDSQIAGIILNYISPMFYETIKTKIEEDLGIKVFGYVPKLENISIESRHLGLIAPNEVEGLRDTIKELADVLSKTLDIEGIIEAAKDTEELDWEALDCKSIDWEVSSESFSGAVTIGVAKDKAFSFHYEDNYALLRRLGAKIVFFSPLHNKKLPKVDGLWFTGGYPELYARELSENHSMIEDIREKINRGIPCIAECGGFLYLNQWLEGGDGKDYPMVGVIKARAYKCNRLQRFGYIELEMKKNSILGREGMKMRTHEFHYYDSESNGEDCMATKPVNKRSYECIHIEENLFVGFPHIYLYSNKEAGSEFIKNCKEYKGRN